MMTNGNAAVKASPLPGSAWLNPPIRARFPARTSIIKAQVSAPPGVAAPGTKTDVKPVVIGIAADSGCGKSTFMRRLTSIFGGESKLNDIGRKSNPEWPDGITALHADCQNWDKMAQDVTDLKAGKEVQKPIYNHITGELDPDEGVTPTPIVIFEGLHPMYDERE